MPHTEKLAPETLKAIAGQVGQLYVPLSGNTKSINRPAQLEESFAIWFLPADAVIGQGEDIAKLVQNTGRWHSQIRIDDSTLAAAQSIPIGPSSKDWQVRQIFEGKLASDVHGAIDWVDDQISDNSVVRLLEVPAFHITAFWLFNESTHESVLVVISLPENARVLQKKQIYSSKEFLDSLRKEPFVAGIQ